MMAPLAPHAQSELLGRKALVAFNRLGDIMLPRNGEYPSFSELGCIEHIDTLIRHAPPEDIAELRSFLTILYYLPGFVSRLVVRLCQGANRWPEPVGTLLRLLDMGTRSVAISLYYSGNTGKDFTGKTPLQLMDFHLCALRPKETTAEATR